ncbi:DUF3011 domain-containing protein [Luteimonas suaedae]|uniref:DUF3011 domain-containing protein n=1 Tax=Luteimonas suaedae TaxID=2605430 RepID=UPI0011EF2334|nr:DUF3011 domain-containing protein [Luteimonas suaedae]
MPEPARTHGRAWWIALPALLWAAMAVPSLHAQQRAYAPEDLRTLSVPDQTRVIRLEYSEQSGGGSIPSDQLRFYLDQVNRSDWTFSRIKQDIARSLGDGHGGEGGPEPSIVCGSERGGYAECRTGWTNAALSQNLSSIRCSEGVNWGVRPGLVWVDQGCRARFVEAMAASETVRCESPRGRRQECRTGFRGQALLTRQLSSTACIEGRTWGQSPGRVWVDAGCRGEFTRIPGSAPPHRPTPPPVDGYTVTCSSTDGRPYSCAWDSRRGRPVLVEQLSQNPCDEGLGWGYVGDRLWVNRGCHARFGVAGSARPEYSVQCTSSAGAISWCEWDDRNGRPRLAQEFSSGLCREGRTWDYLPRRGIWVSNACSARFSNR